MESQYVLHCTFAVLFFGGNTAPECHKSIIPNKSNKETNTNAHQAIKFSKNENNVLVAFNLGHLKSGRAPYSKGEVLKPYSHERW